MVLWTETLDIGDTEQPRFSNRGELDSLASSPGAALYSAKDSIKELNLAWGQEQLKYQYRPMTSGEEEISRIYEDGIYRPPDMIEKPGSLWVTGSNMRPRAGHRLFWNRFVAF